MANDQPVTRKERFLAGAAGEDITLDTPITREERFLAKAAGMDVKTDDPVTRSEKYLAKIAEGGGGGSVPEYEGSYTVTPSESEQTLSCKDKKMTDDVSVSAISSTYIGSGITQKAAATYTPTTSDQTIAANQYLAGAQTVKGDANLVAGNIKKDMQIFGVTGTYEGSGGGAVDAPIKDVNFYDYDGTRVYSYTAAEFLALSAMPENPTHSGLTAQGWNWSLADAKDQVTEIGACDIGQMYVTDDGKTRIYIQLFEGNLNPSVGLGLKGTAVIDWGDGTNSDTITGSSYTTIKYASHLYSNEGLYTISISIISGNAVICGDSTTTYLLVNTPYSSSNTFNKLYSSSIQKIELGNSVTIGTYGLYYCSNLKAISVPDRQIFYNSDMTQSYKYFFANTGKLNFLTIPKMTNESSKIIPYGAFADSSFSYISLPKIQYLKNSEFFRSLVRRLILPNSITEIGQFSCQGMIGASKLIIPSSVTTLNGVGYNIGLVRLLSSTPPTVTSSGNLSARVLEIPYDSVSYLTATNYPSTSSSTYMGFGTFADQSALPSQDTTQAYNLTWYATKEDAISQTNAITVGNGNEIYCRYTAV